MWFSLKHTSNTKYRNQRKTFQSLKNISTLKIETGTDFEKALDKTVVKHLNNLLQQELLCGFGDYM